MRNEVNWSSQAVSEERHGRHRGFHGPFISGPEDIIPKSGLCR